MEGRTLQHTVAEKIEFLVALKELKCSVEEAADVFGIPRTTLLGYITAEDEIFSTDVDPGSRCVTRPGLPPPTGGFEAPVVALVKRRAAEGDSMSRSEIVVECARVIPGVSDKSGGAQNSWLTRFISRHKLAGYIARYPRKVKHPRSELGLQGAKRPKLKSSTAETTQEDVSSLAEKPQQDVSSLAEKTQDDVSSLAEKTQDDVSSLAEKPQQDVSSLAEKTQDDVSSLAEKPQQDVSSLAEKTQDDVSSLAEKTQDDVSSLAEKPQQDVSSLAEKTQDDVSSLAEKTQDDVSSLAEKPQQDVSSLAEKTHEVKGAGSRVSPVVIEDGGEGASELPSEYAGDDSPLVCETMARCFRLDQQVSRLQVTEKNLKCLDPKEWLNDIVISYFIREFMEAHESTYNFDGQLFGLIFMKYYSTYNRNMVKTYEATKGITAKFPYDKYPTILIPVCMDAHWSFVVIQNPVRAFKGLAPTMLHVDSLQYHNTDKIQRVLCGYFRKEALEKYKVKRVTYNIKCYSTKPRQDNGYDCGILMLYFMRQVNRMIVRTDGKIRLPLSMTYICTIPKKDRAHFNCNKERMNFVKLFRNEQTLQANCI